MPDGWEIRYGLDPNDPSDARWTAMATAPPTSRSTSPARIRATPPARRSSRRRRPTFDTVRITFSEALDPATATDVANYAITPSLAVTSAPYDQNVVTLTTAPKPLAERPTR
jgi:hypothetical protein